MQVLFVDVGQGTCQIILLGGQRAIVIDAGAAPGTALRILRLHKITRLEHVVISHSHIDHSGGAAKRARLRDGAVSGILADYSASIGTIWCVHDHLFYRTALASYLLKLQKDKTIRSEQVQFISAGNAPQELWGSDDGNTVLAAIAPTGGHLMMAHASEDANAACAILELRHRGHRIVFTGDSVIDQWRDVYRLRGGTPMKCRVLTMPHHGGLMGGTASDFNWFCTTATDADVVVLSVATANQHRHPREEVVQAFASRGCHVMCTQITSKCCGNLESVRPGVIGTPLMQCQSSSKPEFSKTGRSKNVACAGTVSATLDAEGITVDREQAHTQGVDALVTGSNLPLCRHLLGTA